MKKLLLVGVAAAVAVSAVPAYAGGRGAETETIHFEDTNTFLTEGECGLPEGTVATSEFKGVIHTTEGRDEQFHTTGTFVGDLTITLPDGTVYTGHFADWFGFNSNSRNEGGTFTSNNIVTAADGSRLTLHFLDHFNLSATGEPHPFFQLNCGGGDVTRD